MFKQQAAITFLLILIVVLLLIRMYLLVDYGVLNYEYADIYQQIKDYEDKNLLLKESLYSESSLTNIYEKAVNKHGFLPRTTIFYFK